MVKRRLVLSKLESIEMIQYQVVMVKVASEEDYFAVKQETRPPLADTLDLVDGGFIPVPVKYIRVTSCGGVKWSMNRFENLSKYQFLKFVTFGQDDQ